ncbi:MAG: thiamine phosphate synthase [Proteobacteria bacterium]|nr:thiamine phosphate synthase [Pseudomonadota bacterium]
MSIVWRFQSVVLFREDFPVTVSLPHSGLYVITPQNHASPQALAKAVVSALRGGVKVIQYRSKSSRDQRQEARMLLVECRAFQVPLIINDDVELALDVGADGVHLGKDDGSIVAARKRLGVEAIIGVSCYNSLERAVEAEALGATYVAFGRFFPSANKPNAPCAQLDTLIAAKQRLHLPIVAIGGITHENGRSLIDAGADLLAVIDGVFGVGDPEQAALAFKILF